MQMSDAIEVVQVGGALAANKHLGLGWTLLAVVPGLNNNAKSSVIYVLGRSGPLPEVPKVEIPGML